jgi:hypothetical protein
MQLTGVKVNLDYKASEDTRGSVVIGLGDPNLEGAGQSVFLNHKGYRAERLASVTQFVASASDSLWSMWKARIATSADITALVVEDYSLDTCFAWLLFGARLEGRPVSRAEGFDESAWVDYVTAWEKGEFVDVAVETSPACLFTELGNAVLPRSGAAAAPSFARCLQYLQEMLDACPTPPVGGLPSTFSSDLHRQALAQVGFDRQQYSAALQRGKTFQLFLPSSISGSDTERLMIVDAAATEETEPTAVLKTMLRTDLEKSWTRRGFSVWALYRPTEVRKGNDMTVSVDPDRYLSLKALWARLEQMEDERWRDARPRWNPRALVSYTDAGGKPKAGSPNQPWWDDNGTYTLVGAPKGVEPLKGASEVDGTRLDWYKDVLPALWELYFLRHVRSLVKFTEPEEVAGRHVHVAVWQPSNAAADNASDSYRLLPDAPSFHAWLAACSQHADPWAVTSPMELPDAEAFERVALEDGYAIITREGVTLFRETRARTPDVLRKVAKGVAMAVRSYSDFLRHHQQSLVDLVQELQRESKKGAAARPAGTKNVADLEQALFKPRADVLLADVQLAILPPGFDEQRLRGSLARMWGLHEQRDEVRSLIERVDQLMRQHIAMRTEMRERIYGLLLSATGLAIAQSYLTGPILRLLPLTPTGLQVISVLLLALFFLVGLLLFSRFGIRGGSGH